MCLQGEKPSKIQIPYHHHWNAFWKFHFFSHILWPSFLNFLKLIRTWSQISTDSIDRAADCNCWSKLTALSRVDLFSQIWVLTQFDHFGFNGVKDYSSFRMSEPDQITVLAQIGFVWPFKMFLSDKFWTGPRNPWTGRITNQVSSK